MSNLNPRQFAKIDPHASSPDIKPMHHEMYPTMQGPPKNNPWPETVPDLEEGRRAVINSLNGLYPPHQFTARTLMRHTTPN